MPSKSKRTYNDVVTETLAAVRNAIVDIEAGRMNPEPRDRQPQLRLIEGGRGDVLADLCGQVCALCWPFELDGELQDLGIQVKDRCPNCGTDLLR